MRERPIQLICAFVLWTCAFAVVYTQDPLYSSNQNTKFVHALADVNAGTLREDWLASTVDPFPLFTALASCTLTYLPPETFYVFMGLILAAYLFSVTSIATKLYNRPECKNAWWVFLIGMTLLHSMLARHVVLWATGHDLLWLAQSGVADQYILGSVFQPCVFGVFLITSIAFYLHGRHVTAVTYAGVAAIVHPAYLMMAGVLVATYTAIECAYRLTWFQNLKRRAFTTDGTLRLDDGSEMSVYVSHLQRGEIPAGAETVLATPPMKISAAMAMFIAWLGLCLPVIIYLAISFTPGTPAVHILAREILVNVRIPHHTIVRVWLDNEAMVRIAWMLLGLWCVRGTRLFWIMVIPLAGMLACTVGQQWTGSSSLAALQPWRVSAMLIPLATVAIFVKAARLGEWLTRGRFIENLWTRQVGYACVILAAMWGVKVQYDRFDRLAADESAGLSNYVRHAHKPGDLYVIPSNLERFRLAAEVPVLANRKSHPNQDGEIVEWYQRLLLTDEAYAADPVKRVTAIATMRECYGVTHVVLRAEDSSGAGALGDSLGETIFSDDAFVVVKLAPTAAATPDQTAGQSWLRRWAAESSQSLKASELSSVSSESR